MQLLTSVVTSKFSCPTFRVFPGKRHESSTSQPAPLFTHLASSSWELIPPFCGEKNLLLTFLADFPSYSPFFKKNSLFAHFLVATKILQNSISSIPFLHKELQLTHPKFQFRRRHLSRKSRFAEATRVVHREAEIISPQRDFFWVLYARYLENSSMNEWKKENLEPGLYTPQKRKDIHRSVFGIYVFGLRLGPPSKILAANEWWGVAPRLVVHLQRIHPRRLT